MLCLLFILFLELNLHRALPSDEIWNKTQLYIKEGKMNVPPYLQYFIFDESNYTALDINSEKMNYLYLNQFELSLYGVLNYIFIVDELNQSIESLESVTNNLAEIINKQYFISKDYALILFISNNTQKYRIHAGGKITEYYSDYILGKISTNLRHICILGTIIMHALALLIIVLAWYMMMIIIIFMNIIQLTQGIALIKLIK